MQLQDAIADFLLYLEDHGNSDLTITSYRSDLRQFLAFLRANQGPTTLEEIRPVWIRSFLREKRRQGLSTSSVARKLNCLRSFFKFCVLQEWLERNPAQSVEAPKIAETLPSYLREDEVYRLLNAVNQAKHCFAKRDRALIKLLLTTGIRRSELINLNWEDINFKEKTLTVRQGKGKKDRIIPLKEEVLQDLWDYLQTRLPLTNNALFLSRQKTRINKDSLARILKKYIQAAGINEKKVTAHTFRHTFATSLIHQGVDVAVVKDLMGHEDIQTTMKYTHTSNAHRIAAIDKLFLPGLSNYSQKTLSANSWEKMGDHNKQKGAAEDNGPTSPSQG